MRSCIDCGYEHPDVRRFPSGRYRKSGVPEPLGGAGEYAVYEGAVCWICALVGTRIESWDRDRWLIWLFAAAGQRRRARWRVIGRWLKHRYRLWTALPGDVFHAYDRDSILLVHSRRNGQLIGWEVCATAVDHAGGVWEAIAHNPRETWLPNLRVLRL